MMALNFAKNNPGGQICNSTPTRENHKIISLDKEFEKGFASNDYLSEISNFVFVKKMSSKSAEGR